VKKLVRENGPRRYQLDAWAIRGNVGVKMRERERERERERITHKQIVVVVFGISEGLRSEGLLIL
jgi:hypothetical protein